MMQRIAALVYVLNCSFAATIPRLPTSRLAAGNSSLQEFNHTFANSPTRAVRTNVTNLGVV